MLAWVRRWAALLVTGAGVAVLTACSAGTDAAARVNGEPISRLELQRETDRLADRLRAGGPGQTVEMGALRTQTLDRLILLRLMRQQAHQEGIMVSSGDVDTRIAQLVERNGGRDQFLALIQDEGLSAPEIRRVVEDQLLGERLAARHSPAPAVMDERRVRHLLLDSAEKAQAARQRLIGGEGWDKVAAEVSADPGTRTRGGDLGFLQRGQTVPPFDAAAFSLPVNEISQPVQTSFGYHVLQVLETRSQPPSPEQVAAQQQRQLVQYLGTLRRAATIDIADPGGRP